jgi:hypothetical protein
MGGNIFINYRRGDDPGFTQALYQQLEAAFGDDQLFMDVEGHIKPGEDFVHVLEKQVARADVLLAIVGPRWLELLTARNNAPDDFVVIEIESALRHKKRVVPILVGGASMPPDKALPLSIRDLARCNALTLHADRFKSDCLTLVEALRDIFKHLDEERAAVAAAAEAAKVERSKRSMTLSGMSPEEIIRLSELAFWQDVEATGDPEKIRRYLNKHRDHWTATEARAALYNLPGIEPGYEAYMELSDRYGGFSKGNVHWATAIDMSDDLRDFAIKWPNSKYSKDAQSYILSDKAIQEHLKPEYKKNISLSLTEKLLANFAGFLLLLTFIGVMIYLGLY